MYPWQEVVEAMPLFSFEDACEMNARFEHLLPPSYNMHAPQHLLASYLFHKEGQLCQACRYNYAGHAEGMTLANATYAWTAEVET